LIGCAMAIAWPDLGADRRSASGRMRRSVFARRETKRVRRRDVGHPADTIFSESDDTTPNLT
jgi:hypothetical protein